MVIVPVPTDEQIEAARAIDLFSYLQSHEPQELIRKGSHYVMASHDSLVIDNGKWFRFSREVGGYSALDFLIKVRGMDFVDAVSHLTDGAGTAPYQPQRPPPQAASPPKLKKPFALPPANINNDMAIAYLRGRGISKAIINRCIENGTLYESRYFNPASPYHNAPVCVFVGKDGDKAKFACQRGITDDLKKDVTGSDKRFGFVLPPNNPDSRALAVFESPVDALAHHDIHEMGKTAWDGYRLALGGVSSLALISFLERHTGTDRVYLCLDNDTAGKEATERIIKLLLSDKKFSRLVITAAPPPIGKDYGDTLQAIQQLNKQQAIENRHDKAVFSI